MTDRNKTPDPREDKLPRWAQNELSRLRADLNRAKEKLAVGPEDSNTFSDKVLGPGTPLGHDTKIRFQMDTYEEGRASHHYIECRIDRYQEKSYLYVMGGDSIVVEPQSSNVVRLHVPSRSY